METIINVFETDSLKRNYSTIYIYRDGPGQIRQLTLGFGITEYGNMKRLIQVYLEKNGTFDDDFAPYVNKIGKTPLVDNTAFRTLLNRAAKEDQKFRDAEDEIFDEKYWNPAVAWAQKNGFTKPLSMMVILDSFIHSGSILGFLRNRFNENVPANGGSEEKWISEYIRVRRSWLASHSNKILRNTVYRMDFFLNQLKNNNWTLKCPLVAHGKTIC